MEEILKLGRFLEQLDSNDWTKGTSLIKEVAEIVTHYQSLLVLYKDGKDSNGFSTTETKKLNELQKYFFRINDQLDKLRYNRFREEELYEIANFLQKKLPINNLSKLEKILNDYQQAIDDQNNLFT